MKIYIPSYKRPDTCTTAKNLSEAVICCHEFEAEEYRVFNKNDIMVLPDNIGGKGMGIIRNYILDHTTEKELVMMDDDIQSIGFWEDNERTILVEDEVYEFIRQAFRMTKELGTVLWGLNMLEDKKAYREFTPFSFSQVVLAPVYGIIKSEKVRFDESLGLKEDYDYSLQVLMKYRKILRFNKYHYVAGHLDMKGGCSTYRSSEKEIQQMQMFREKWGDKIVKFKDKDTNPIVHPPIKGI